MSARLCTGLTAVTWIVAAAALAQEPRPLPKQPMPAQKPAAQPADAQKPAAQPGAEKSTDEAAALPRCPVMNEAVDFNTKTMTADGPVYFCCSSCIKKFEANPEKYTGKVQEQRAALAKMPKVQVTCPVSGKEVDQAVSIEQNGQKIYFCCKNCPAKYEKEPAAYKAKLADSYCYQTKCPVTGDKIDPAAYAELPTGGRVYFCCSDCIPQFKKDPAKYAPALDKQGVGVDVKAMKAEAQQEKKAEHKARGGTPAGEPQR